MEKGICFGVSVGPGDPELMTIKACNIIKNSDVIFLPSAPKEKCRVYQIIKKAMPEILEEKYVCVDTAGMADPYSQGERYDILAESVKGYLDKGLNVTFPALGEVSLYSTYMYVFFRLTKEGYICENMSGISSVQEAVNRLGISLATGNEQVHIFPDTENLLDRLKISGTKVFMKPKGDMNGTIKAITEYSQNNTGITAYGISNCGTSEEIIAYDISELSKLKGYMTVIIVKG